MNGQASKLSESVSVQNVKVLTGTVKRCPKCGETKAVSDFWKNQTYCKICQNKATQRWKKEHLDQARVAQAKWTASHRDKSREYARKYISKNREKHRDANRKYRLEYPEKARESCLKWRRNHPDIKAFYRKSQIERNSTSRGKINSNISRNIATSLINGSKKNRHWEDLVGYTIDQLKRHLEKQFKTGMSWENYGKYGWHIDHKIPISAFNFETPDDPDFKRCWALKNLQPLEADKNLKKWKKLNKPFQPSLMI